MKKKLFLTALLALLLGQVHADEGRLLRFPSTNGTDVVFSYAGDLYKAPLSGGQAVRLTSHVGYEMFARFSPNGRSIAFTGEYDGNREVYLIPSEGGTPKRLTYTSTNPRDDLGDRMGPNNMVLTWSKDGKSIVYRNRIGDGFSGKLWTISPKGGMSEQIPLPEGGFCSYSPDGKLLAYNRVMREFRTWKYYRGGMADDIWIYDQARGKVENITNNDAQDIIPMWVGDEIYFISDRDMTMNIFCYNTKTKTTSKVTNYTDYDVKFPSTNGQVIVYEKGGYLFLLDPATKQSRKIDITLSAEGNYARQEIRDLSTSVTATSLSYDGKRLAVTARGEVFDVPSQSGVIKNLTRSSESNDRGAVYSPDATKIAWIGDATGETEIYLLDRATSKTEVLTRNTDTYIRRLYFTPDGSQLLFTDRKNRIQVIDLATRKQSVILTCPESEISSISFSPDSKWIAYTRPESNQMSVVYLMELSTKKEYPVTEKWYDSSSPAFSTDGKYLFFISNRDLSPIYSRIEWDYAYTNMSAAYMVMLSKDTPSPFLIKDSSAEEKEEPKAKDGKDAKASEAATVRFDAQDIFSRIIKLPIPSGSYRSFYSDGKTFFYQDGSNIKALNLSTQKTETVGDGVTFTMSMGAKKALFQKGGQYYVGELSSGKVSLKDPVSLKGMTTTIDYPKEWAQIFDDIWRSFRDGFYLENMHGVDWKAIKQKYAALLPWVRTRLDLNYVVGEMISEVACGHAYISPGEKPEAERIDMGLLGAEITRDKSGFFKIGHILQGAVYTKTLRSPLTEPGLGVKEGEYIVSVNGVPANVTDNIYSLLIGKADVATELGINTKPSLDGARQIIIKPISDEYPLYHYEWVQKNIQRVEKATNGRVGYIYIPDMSQEGLNEFVRYYYPQLDKEALIIDDRANGGGNVSPMIIERLQREAYRLTMRRTSSLIGTIPEGTQTGPKVLLIDKYSASDGDLFPWSFKANNLGTVIGTRTWGGIIGISGSLPYQDGTDVRVPFFTNYDAKTGEWIIENHGVDPDILIDNDPIKEQAGVDEQLEKAIEVALEQIKDRKPLPGVPAPRTYKDLGL